MMLKEIVIAGSVPGGVSRGDRSSGPALIRSPYRLLVPLFAPPVVCPTSHNPLAGGVLTRYPGPAGAI